MCFIHKCRRQIDGRHRRHGKNSLSPVLNWLITSLYETTLLLFAFKIGRIWCFSSAFSELTGLCSSLTHSCCSARDCVCFKLIVLPKSFTKSNENPHKCILMPHAANHPRAQKWSVLCKWSKGWVMCDLMITRMCGGREGVTAGGTIRRERKLIHNSNGLSGTL